MNREDAMPTAEVERLEVRFGERVMPMLLGYRCTESFAERICAQADHLLLVADRQVHRLWGQPLQDALAKRVPVTCLLVDADESAKTLDVLHRLLDQAVAGGTTRRSAVVAFGGGLTGNVAGLLAGLLYRGIPLIHVPTTLLAMSDSVLSQKQAVNGEAAKNLYGLYHLPVLCCVDVQYLHTLPSEAFSAGVVELCKNGLAFDAETLPELERLASLGDHPEGWLDLVRLGVRAKQRLLLDDPLEHGAGVVLEYGHTVGHALELETGTLPHGHAVGLGMLVAAAIAHGRGWIGERDEWLHARLLARAGAPLGLPHAVPFEAVLDRVRLDNRSNRPLYLIVLATKPCYIKLASLVLACVAEEVPFLLIDSGQHYAPELTQARRELGYEHLLGAVFGIRGTLLQRAAQLAHCIEELAERLERGSLRQAAVPVVSGDTATAALFPPYWYLARGLRSVHVEAGLRSLGPTCPEGWEALGELTEQRALPWRPFVDDPFPEGADTRLASVASELLLAPVPRNVEALLADGYSESCIRRVGSLSSDAVRLAQPLAARSNLFARYPELARGRWLRVDLHRRENMTPDSLGAVLAALGRLAADGMQVVLILTNALLAALRQHALEGRLEEARSQGLAVHELWPHYTDVIHFMQSPHCLGLYTDSGGLQEEAAVLGVPCLTCRYSTDRPETVLDSRSNLLLPPVSEDFVFRHVRRIFDRPLEQSWPALAAASELYGHDVGLRIARLLGEQPAPTPLAGAQLQFAARSAPAHP